MCVRVCSLQQIFFFMYCLDLLRFQCSSVPLTNFCNFFCNLKKKKNSHFHSVFSQSMNLVKPQRFLKWIAVPVEQPNTDLPSMAIGRKTYIPKTTQVSSDHIIDYSKCSPCVLSQKLQHGVQIWSFSGSFLVHL